MIIVQYYNVLCAKFHLKKSFTKGSMTQYVLRVLDASQKLAKGQGTKPTKSDAYASLHRTVTCFCNYLCCVDTRPSYFEHPQPGFTKREFTSPHILKMQMAFWCIRKLFPKQHLTELHERHRTHYWVSAPNNLMLLILAYV